MEFWAWISEVRLDIRTRDRESGGRERIERLAEGSPRWADVCAESSSFMYALPKRCPHLSAVRVLSSSQKVVLVLLVATVAGSLALDRVVTATIVNGFFLTFYLIFAIFKSYLIHVSIGARREMQFTGEELASLDDGELPLYTVLVPLYEEVECLEGLLDALERLDYPKEKLDVLWLFEEGDEETLDAAERMHLPDFVRLAVAPRGQPRTKPRACNLGLALARGEYLVVFDAEDRPEPDQLKKAFLAFRRLGPELVCVQAKLDFYNQHQNLLTKWFTTEYAVWFDLFLPGLDHLEFPIPLGGSSNHFRVDALRQLLGWDPYNVTEDCDLGVRSAQAGYGIRTIDSTTWEEACSVLTYWIRQRSRWTKGYIQTFLVHNRRPLSLLKKLGLARTLSFQLMVGGTFLCLLINPIYWSLALLWFAFRWQMFGQLFPYPLILWGLACLFVGNFLFVYASMLACCRRGNYELVKHCLILPLYWVLMSVGAWLGFLQLLTRPSHWEKTRHGLHLGPAGE